MVASRLAEFATQLSKSLRPVIRQVAKRGNFVYDPTQYARKPYEAYLDKYAKGRGKTLLLGMNPGPWGMAQTGVPFGSVPLVRDWLRIDGEIGKPKDMHPSYPVAGWECERVEVSGMRLWGMLRERFGNPRAMSKHVLVMNYCPLLLLEPTARGRCRNLPVDKLTCAHDLLDMCDKHLLRMIDLLSPRLAIGVGAFATKRLRDVAKDLCEVAQILHPSPASPKANRGFAEQAHLQLDELGVARA